MNEAVNTLYGIKLADVLVSGEVDFRFALEVYFSEERKNELYVKKF